MKFKTSIDKEKISQIEAWFIKTWPTLLIITVVIIFISLSFVALYPKMDQKTTEEGRAQVKALDIKFDTKLIEELGATQKPSELKASGGRDPFAGY